MANRGDERKGSKPKKEWGKKNEPKLLSALLTRLLPNPVCSSCCVIFLSFEINCSGIFFSCHALFNLVVPQSISLNQPLFALVRFHLWPYGARLPPGMADDADDADGPAATASIWNGSWQPRIASFH